MKKKLKIMKVTAVILAVAFCTLLGCERKEKEAGELLLPLDESGDFPAELAEAADFGENPADASGSGTANPCSGAEDADGGKEAQAAAGNEISPGTSTETLAGIPGQENGTLPAEREAEKEERVCVVHVCGAVKEPGVYIMGGDARIYQAIEKAGGFDSEADENYLNQADLLLDGMKIYVPTREETAKSDGEIPWKIAGENGVPDAKSTGDGGEEQGETSKEGGVPVNINTAGEAELCTLPGVGSSKAKSIIAYREKNGAYRTIEEIMNVEGIKDGVFRKIKDSITV